MAEGQEGGGPASPPKRAERLGWRTWCGRAWQRGAAEIKKKMACWPSTALPAGRRRQPQRMPPSTANTSWTYCASLSNHKLLCMLPPYRKDSGGVKLLRRPPSMCRHRTSLLPPRGVLELCRTHGATALHPASLSVMRPSPNGRGLCMGMPPPPSGRHISTFHKTTLLTPGLLLRSRGDHMIGCDC